MNREDPLADDISAIHRMALDLMSKDGALAKRMLHVAEAAGAWHTIIVDPKVQRRFREPWWMNHLFIATFVLAVGMLALFAWRAGINFL